MQIAPVTFNQTHRGSVILDYRFAPNDGGAILHEAFDGVVDFGFTLGVDLAGGLVENEDGGILDDGAGDDDPL